MILTILFFTFAIIPPIIVVAVLVAELLGGDRK